MYAENKMMVVVLMVVVAGMSGCLSDTHNRLTLADAGRVEQHTSAASAARMTSEGELTAAFNGVAPAQMMLDPNGMWSQSQDQPIAWKFPTPYGDAYAFFAKDTEVGEFLCQYDPATEGMAIKVTAMTSALSTLHVDALHMALTVLDGMTKTQAEATVHSWAEAGKIAPDLRDVLLAWISGW